MERDPRHDILFEPVRIGPVTAKNRFWDGHRAARELEGESGDEAYFKREYTVVEGC